MTAPDLFGALAPFLAPRLEAKFGRRDLCILATRVALDVAEYFRIPARPVAVRAIAYNAEFAARVASGGDFSGDWKSDGSYSVGIGYGKTPGKWTGHLIAAADGVFADFSIGQAEREQYGIITGRALVGPWTGADLWKASNDRGTVVEYQLLADDEYLRAPDWCDRKRRRGIVGELIRRVRNAQKSYIPQFPKGIISES